MNDPKTPHCNNAELIIPKNLINQFSFPEQILIRRAAERAGQSTDEFIQDAIEQHLDELEDAHKHE